MHHKLLSWMICQSVGIHTPYSVPLVMWSCCICMCVRSEGFAFHFKGIVHAWRRLLSFCGPETMCGRPAYMAMSEHVNFGRTYRIHFFDERELNLCVHGRSERLLVRSRCWMPTNGRVRDRRPSGVRVVRHDRSTLRPTPTVYLALPAPHAPTPTSCRTAPRPLGMPSNDPCRSSASCPSPPADGIRLRDPLAGQNHRRSPAGGRSGAPVGALERVRLLCGLWTAPREEAIEVRGWLFSSPWGVIRPLVT